MPEDKQPTNTESGKLFVGLVDAADASTYVLNISPIDRDAISFQKVQGIAISTCFANVFGYKDCDLVQPGSRVLCYLLQPSFCLVLGALPNNDIGVQDYPFRANMGAGDAIVDNANLQGYTTELLKSVLANNRRPTDVVDGEKVIANDYGAMLQLLSFVVGLKGSDLAQVQCHVLDDLVRVISHNWEHNTAMGTFRVFHDGKSIQAEFEATTSPAEAMGVPEVDGDTTASLFTKTKTSTANDLTDFVQLTPNDRAQHIARFKMFLGKLGDFLNIFLSRPSTNDKPRDLAGTEPQTFDTGLFQQRLAMDGGYYLRSVKEVFIEKTNWIRVPQRIRTPEDVSGDDGTQITFNPKVPYEFDNSFQYKDNPFLAYLQLRNYVAYVNENLAYQNFNSYKKDFAVSNSLGQETKLGAIANIDPETPSSLQNFALRSSGMYLMQNGGFLIRDAWGSAIVSEGGNIYIQPAKDLVLQPLRNLVGKVGQYVSVASQYDIDLSSTLGGMRLKSYETLWAYSSGSGVILQSDGLEETAGASGDANGAVDGIVLKSKLGIFNFANQTIANITPQSYIVKAGQDVRVDAQSTAQVSANTAIVFGSSNAALVSSQNTMVLSSSDAIFAGAGSTILGQKGQDIGITFPPHAQIAVEIQGVVQVSQLLNAYKKDVLQDNSLLQFAAPFNTQAAIDGLAFRFLDSAEYGLQAKVDPIPMTLAQQEDQTSGLYSLSAWTETPINGTYPYPGADLFTKAFASTQGAIPNLQPYQGTDYTGKPNSTPSAMSVISDSLDNYKVQT